MANKRVQDLTPAESIQLADRFVLEQAGQAKSLTGQILIDDLATALDGHGGISSITYTEPVAPSLEGTLTITMADETTYDLVITNGNGIESIEIKYGISNVADPAYVYEWYSAVVSPTDALPYAFTRFTITDSTGGTTVAYTITKKADDPTISVGTVTAEAGSTADATVANVGTASNPVLNFDFTLPQGEKGNTGDYIVPVVSYGTSTAAATEPTTWYSSPTSISYSAGNYIWKRTQYTLHDAQTVQDTKTEIIGYIGQNGTGSGTVQQITFNGVVYTDDGTGNVPMTIDAEDVGAIADPSTKSNGQVLTYDSSADAWVAANPSTGGVNTVNNKGVDVGTTNITLYASDIKMSSSDSTTIPNAIPSASSTTPSPLGTAAVGSGTTWARADHVHTMPSAADVGAVSASDVQFKIYDSVADLGLTVGSATIAGAWAAMAGQNAILLCNAEEFSPSTIPSTAGNIMMYHLAANTTRGIIRFAARVSGAGEYAMGIGTDGMPLGTWLLMSAYEAGTVSITNGSKDTSTSTIVNKSGSVVVLQGLTSGSSVTTNWAKLGQITGSSLYPSSIATGIVQAGYNAIQMRVLTTGEIQVRGGSSLSNQSIRFNLTWIT